MAGPLCWNNSCLKEDIPYSHTGRSTQQTKRLSHSEKPMVLSSFMLLEGDKMKANFELWCWRRLLRVPWTARRSNRSILKENQSWIFIGRTVAEAETPILWPPDAKNWLLGKDPDAGKDWRQEKGTTEDEIVGWHHRLDGHEFEQALGVGDGREGKPSVLQCMEWQRVRHNWVTELTDWKQEVDYLPRELQTRKIVSGL